jgi:Na+/phosphate symporter
MSVEMLNNLLSYKKNGIIYEMDLKDLARSEYYETLKKYFEDYIEFLKEPEVNPIQDLVQANVRREKILWLQTTAEFFKRLREQEDDIEVSDSYE